MCASARGVSPTASTTTSVMPPPSRRARPVGRASRPARAPARRRAASSSGGPSPRARSRCRSRPPGGGWPASRAADERARACRAARPGSCARGSGAPARGSGPATRAGRGRPPARASGRSSTPATWPFTRSRDLVQEARLVVVGRAARARARSRAPTQSALDTCAFTTGTRAAARRASAAAGVLELDREVAGVEADARSIPAPGRRGSPPPGRPSRSRTPAPARAPAGCAGPCRASSCASASATARARPGAVASARRPSPRASPAAASRCCPPRRRRAAARASSRPGPSVYAGRSGSAQSRPVHVALDHRGVEGAVREAVQRHDLEAGRRAAQRSRSRPARAAAASASAGRASQRPTPSTRHVRALAHRRRVAPELRRPRRRGRPPDGRSCSTRGGRRCRRMPEAHPHATLAAQHRVALEGRREVALAELVEDQPAALAEELDRVAPDDPVDRRRRRSPPRASPPPSSSTLSGSLTPQSPAELISIRSVPCSSRMRTIRCSSILVSG